MPGEKERKCLKLGNIYLLLHFFFFFFLRFKVRVAGDYACGWGDKGVNGSDLRVNKSDERVATEACVRIKIQD